METTIWGGTKKVRFSKKINLPDAETKTTPIFLAIGNEAKKMA